MTSSLTTGSVTKAASSDSGNTALHLRRARTSGEGGRDLLLVAPLTRRWGTRQSTQGKTIWAERTFGPVQPGCS